MKIAKNVMLNISYVRYILLLGSKLILTLRISFNTGEIIQLDGIR